MGGAVAGDAGGSTLLGRAWVRVEDLPPLLAYALLFHLTHSIAASAPVMNLLVIPALLVGID